MMIIIIIMAIMMTIIRKNDNNYSQEICSCFENHALKSLLLSVKTANQLKFVESKK